MQGGTTEALAFIVVKVALAVVLHWLGTPCQFRISKGAIWGVMVRDKRATHLAWEAGGCHQHLRRKWLCFVRSARAAATLRFPELVITISMDAGRLGCRLWNSVARNTGSGGTVLTGLPVMPGGTGRMGRPSWVVGAVMIRRIVQGCFGDDGLVLSILELEIEISGWWACLLQTPMARAEQPPVMKGKEWQQQARLLCQVWVHVALKL